MTDAPEVKEQVEQQEEQQQEEEIEVEEYAPPKHAKRVYHTIANPPSEELFEDDNLLFIKLIHTKENLSVNRITDHDHLTDKNWDEWKEKGIFQL